MANRFTNLVLRRTLKAIPDTRRWRGPAPVITHERTANERLVTITWWSEDGPQMMSFTNYSVFEIARFLLRLDWRLLTEMGDLSEEEIRRILRNTGGRGKVTVIKRKNHDD
jgi:hypothetical protein